MSVIQIRVDDQQIALTNMPVIASGGIEENQIEFDFSSDWAGFACVACFYRENKSYTSLISATGVASVPNEVVATDGKMWLGVMGVRNGVTKTSELVFYKILQGAITEEFDPGEPTPDIYNQILDYVSGVVDLEQRLIGVEHQSSTNATNIATQTGRIDNIINSQQNESVTTLWTGTLDTKNQSVTLSESIANFDFIDIYGGDVDDFYIRKPVSNTINYQLQVQNMSDDASSQFLRWWESGLTISGTTATITKCIKCYWDDFSQVPVVSQATDGVLVTRICGVKIGHVENDEIVDARVGEDGITYANLGKAIRTQFENVNEDFISYDESLGYRMSLFDGHFAVGGLDSYGALLPSQKYRVSSDTPILLDHNICITPKSGFRFGYCIFTNNVSQWSGWFTTSKIVPAGITFSLQLARVSERTGETADVNEFTSSFIIGGLLTDNVKNNSVISKSSFIETDQFERGSLSGFGTEDNTEEGKNTRIRSAYLPLIKSKAVYCVHSFSVKEYDANKTFLNDSGWIDNTNYYELREDSSYCRIVIRKTGNKQIADEEIPSLTKTVLLVSNTLEITKTVQTHGENIQTNSNNIQLNNDYVLNGYYELQQSDFERGNYEGDGKHNANNRIRTKKLYKMLKGTKIKLVNLGSLYVAVMSYSDENYSDAENPVAWTNVPQEVTLTRNCYVAFNFANGASFSQSTDIYPSDYVNVVTRLHSTYAEMLFNELPSTSYSYHYVGEKFEPLLGFNSERIIRLSYSGSQYTLNDIAFYGDYIFFCLNPGTIWIYQYSTRTKVAELNVGTQHFACVAFSDEFYDPTDPFPLMYADTTHNGIYDVIRFTAIDTASVIKQYKFDTSLYGGAPQVCFDFANNRAYAVCDDVNESNKYKLFTFDLSNETDNGDGTYSFEQISSGSFPFYQTRQGNTFHRGKMFMAFANTGSPYNPKVVSFDCSSGDAVIASEFNSLPFSDEAEGLDIYPINGTYHMFITNYYDLFELTFN